MIKVLRSREQLIIKSSTVKNKCPKVLNARLGFLLLRRPVGLFY